jgi:hypothetical protein
MAAENQSILPPMDQIIDMTYQQVRLIRKSNMSKKDLIGIMQEKEQVATARNNINFWEGAMDLLDEALEVKAFSELEYFRDFKSFVKRRLRQEEFTYSSCLENHIESKKKMLNFWQILGKLKGLNMIRKLREKYELDPAEFKKALLARVEKLMERLEKADLDLV